MKDLREYHCQVAMYGICCHGQKYCGGQQERQPLCDHSVMGHAAGGVFLIPLPDRLEAERLFLRQRWADQRRVGG